MQADPARGHARSTPRWCSTPRVSATRPPASRDWCSPTRARAVAHRAHGAVALARTSERCARPLRGRAFAEERHRRASCRAPAARGEPGRWRASTAGRCGGRATPRTPAVGSAPTRSPSRARARRCASTCARAASWGCCRWCTSSAQVLGAEGWTLPPPRASFVIDDPNLHWPSYGYLDYRELVAHAPQHGYHVGLATVPLDGWLIDRRAAALVARNAVRAVAARCTATTTSRASSAG